MKNVKVGTARVTSGAHYGWKDWLAQRITGALVLLFVIAVLVQFLIAPTTFEAWHAFMTCAPMKILTFFTLLAVCYHAWIGVRDIWMDYIKNVGLRLTLHVFTILWLLGCAAYGVSALWK
ncbi:succinate dehydrogenase, hydrophobic membrane anchor protein [Hydromonas duriensis]|uniref:Succinate dehydrogenase hydrophobic membrane anchor subunit n=1 Tax=Hydromonas duriensis TaxID=1527608 RepID=A0A4R6Y8S8_9BURK|nr:succinate dehydrogenase, hydrophobic membrane anchor protein [Hydromonas duriensis]TDR31822.1 succinate dehydrogenase subunit D [Hydromonas duriensis]